MANNDFFLTGDDELARRLDACELNAWSAFTGRARLVAGE